MPFSMDPCSHPFCGPTSPLAPGEKVVLSGQQDQDDSEDSGVGAIPPSEGSCSLHHWAPGVQSQVWGPWSVSPVSVAAQAQALDDLHSQKTRPSQGHPEDTPQRDHGGAYPGLSSTPTSPSENFSPPPKDLCKETSRSCRHWPGIVGPCAALVVLSSYVSLLTTLGLCRCLVRHGDPGCEDVQGQEEDRFLHLAKGSNLQSEWIHLRNPVWPACRILSLTLAIPKAKQVRLGMGAWPPFFQVLEGWAAVWKVNKSSFSSRISKMGSIVEYMSQWKLLFTLKKEK